MNEKNTQLFVNRSFQSLFRNERYFYHKIRDDGAWQPFDAWMVVKGVTIAMEYKISKLKKGINFSQLFKDREHQFKALDAYEKAGGHGLVIVHHYEPRKSRYFIMDHAIAKDYYNTGKQIPWSELEKHEVFTKRDPLKGTIIDFAPYMEQFVILKD